MFHNCNPQDGQLFPNLRQTKNTPSALPKSYRALAELHRALAESHRALVESHRSLQEENEAKDETIQEQQEENEAKDETIQEQQQVIDDLKRERDNQPNYCENDGSSNCAMSRAQICYG